MGARIFTDEQIEFLKNNVYGNSIKDLTAIMNKQFNMNWSEGQIRGYKKNHRLLSGRGISRRYPRVFQDEHIKYMRRYAKGRTVNELTDLMNKRFNKDWKPSQVRGAKKNYKISSGLNLEEFRYKMGHPNPHKGDKTYRIPNGEATQFKKGHVPKNWLPVGSEICRRLSKSSDNKYWLVKVAEPHQWEFKSHLIWEAAHGEKLKPGEVLMYRDGDSTNCTLDNLLKVNRRGLAHYNKNGFSEITDPNLREISLNIIDLVSNL